MRKSSKMPFVEDFVEVLRMVLDYFGVPPEMLVPVWDSQLCGQYRSIVRMIGTNLRLTPTPRVHFEIPLLSYRMDRYVDVAIEAPAIPSFADVMWVLEDKGDDSARTRNHLSSNKLSVLDQDARRCSARPPTQVQRGRIMKQITDPNALKKITALESELLKLRAQIAMIVTTTDVTQSHNTPRAASVSPSPLTSTPRCPAPPPPPPLPPLPPTVPTSSSEISSVAELIRQRRKNDNDLGKGQLKPRDSRPSRGSHDKEIPSMLDVLKDLNQVKLRSVKRSPGGTPVKKRRSKGGTALLNDPAALIAEALKRKFSQYRHNNSSDKENSLDLSPFSSPDTPKIPQHVRRSQGRRHF